MGMVGKKKRSDARKEAKKRSKQANYLRTGPKEGSKGRRQKRNRYGSFKPGHSSNPEGASPTRPGLKARRRSKGLKIDSKVSKGSKSYAKHPLRPLRKRRKMGSARTKESV